MATSKPIAGTLSTGQRYLVCTTTADSGKRRSPLTIAVSRPGETLFSKVFVIRHAEFPGGPGESHKGAALSYPYAVEHDGKLYVGYSNSGDKSTRVGTGRELWNNNSAELAVIPVASLSVAAEANPGVTLESRGLPRILFNNDSDDLKWPAYPGASCQRSLGACGQIPAAPENQLARRCARAAHRAAGQNQDAGAFLLRQLRRARLGT